ncbi:MAG TPA: GNAT family N-acetyltransferase [Aggregatilineales bacterium]|nr:GNAT family N-acetyltransferase [Aggregatilineales bacterium]
MATNDPLKRGVVLRPASKGDQPTIVRMVREAGINPLDLDWRHFLVAEAHGQIVGIGQIKSHRDGSRELASIAVVPAHQGQGIARAIIEKILAGEQGTLYLMCRAPLEGFYVRFGFRRIELDAMPPYFKRLVRFAQFVTPLADLFGAEGIHIVVMRRDAV